MRSRAILCDDKEPGAETAVAAFAFARCLLEYDGHMETHCVIDDPQLPHMIIIVWCTLERRRKGPRRKARDYCARERQKRAARADANANRLVRAKISTRTPLDALGSARH